MTPIDEMDLDDVRRMARAYTPRAFATLIKQTNDPDVAKAAQKVLLDYTHAFSRPKKRLLSEQGPPEILETRVMPANIGLFALTL
jgi:hypothetical protein